MSTATLYDQADVALASFVETVVAPRRNLVRRCEAGCGKPVSNNKRRCLACYQKHLEEILPLVRESIMKLPKEQRPAAIEGLPAELRPMLVLADLTDVPRTPADGKPLIVLSR